MGNVTADRAWDVHPVTEADIEAYLDIYLNSYPAYKTLGNHANQRRSNHERLNTHINQTCWRCRCVIGVQC